ncbi:hypothetical protein GCM10023333_27040 [Ferrimonas pelagia]|uniref:Uncharacterized protein n=1 Tax=Ferrimonas pelagia TaxID=1177826 RepID=A0ABP9F1Q7_9GAMM
MRQPGRSGLPDPHLLLTIKNTFPDPYNDRNTENYTLILLIALCSGKLKQFFSGQGAVALNLAGQNSTFGPLIGREQ